MEQSILKDIRRQLGVGEECSAFDDDLILLINSVFSEMYQLGFGGSPYSISGVDNVWSEIIDDNSEYAFIKEYIYLTVKMSFDPPTNSFLCDAIKKRMDRLEWRLHSYCNYGLDSGSTGGCNE